MGVQAATARRAAKRQRSIDEQKKIDSEQEASRKAAEAAGGGEDEWASNFKLLLQYKGEQGRKWWAARPVELSRTRAAAGRRGRVCVHAALYCNWCIVVADGACACVAGCRCI